VLASAEGCASGRSERLQIAAGAEISGVEIVLDHGGRIAGTLKVAAGTSPDEFLLIVQEQGSQKTHAAALAADGSFHADNLDPGRYQVQAMRSALMTTLQAGRGA